MRDRKYNVDCTILSLFCFLNGKSWLVFSSNQKKKERNWWQGWFRKTELFSNGMRQKLTILWKNGKDVLIMQPGIENIVSISIC